jgi:hypothetical protein
VLLFLEVVEEVVQNHRRNQVERAVEEMLLIVLQLVMELQILVVEGEAVQVLVLDLLVMEVMEEQVLLF